MFYYRGLSEWKQEQGIAKAESYETCRNQYDVIYLDITRFISRSRTNGRNIVADLQLAVIEELQQAFPNCVNENEIYLPDALLGISHATKSRFIIIMDEWDALFRKAKNDNSM